MQAMILAAGFGTRLLPHTKYRPKPLFPILNTPLLLLTIKRLQRAGFSKIIVNCHHLKEQIVSCLADIPGVILQEEEIIVGTGGGLRRALCHMSNEPLLITNGDIYHTVDFAELYEAHRSLKTVATLAMHHYPRFNTVQVADNTIKGFGAKQDGEQLAFTGLHVIDPKILAPIEDGVASCIIDRYRQLLENGENLSLYRVDHCYWTDMGTPEDYLLLHEKLLSKEVECWEEIEHFESKQLVSAKAQLLGESVLEDWCVIGAASGKNVKISRSIVWDGVQLPDSFSCSDAIMSHSPDKPRYQ